MEYSLNTLRDRTVSDWLLECDSYKEVLTLVTHDNKQITIKPYVDFETKSLKLDISSNV